MFGEEQYQYLRRLNSYFVASLALLAIGVLLGALAISYYPEIAEQIENELGGFVKMFRGLSRLKLLIAIFLNNAVKTFLVILLGSVFGVIVALFLLTNGAAIGIAMYSSIQSRGLWPSLLAILPHGVLELPAVLLGASIGLMLGGHAIRRIFGRTDTALKAELGRALRFFFTVIIPLLILAAMIEALITPVVAGL